MKKLIIEFHSLMITKDAENNFKILYFINFVKLKIKRLLAFNGNKKLQMIMMKIYYPLYVEIVSSIAQNAMKKFLWNTKHL